MQNAPGDHQSKGLDVLFPNWFSIIQHVEARQSV